MLLVFGDRRRRTALASYRQAIASGGAAWVSALSGALPWWRLGRPPGDDSGDELGADESQVVLDELGRSRGRERPPLDAAAVLERAVAARGVEAAALAGRTRRPEVVRARETEEWLWWRRRPRRLPALR